MASGPGDRAHPLGVWTSGRRRMLTVIGAVVSVGIHVYLQASMVFSAPGFSLHTFRAYYPVDQLSYLAITENVATGLGGDTEPFTLTGTIYYPRLYYLALGWVARLVDIDPLASWMVLGLALQVVLVATISVVAATLARSPIAALLGAVPFVIGTFSMVTQGAWLTVLQSHAVLWGAYGVMFPLNAGTASLCVTSLAMLGLLLVVRGRLTGRPAAVVCLVAVTAIGALANVQTYSFLMACYVVAYIGAAIGLVRRGSRWFLVATVALLTVVLVSGPQLNRSVGPLAVLVAGLVPTLPGLWLAVRAHLKVAAAGVVLAAAAAAPQVLSTLLALRRGDPFLLWRQDLTAADQLSVPLTAGLVGAVALGVPLLALLGLGLLRGEPFLVAYPLGAGVAWALGAANGVWGANQEPYRFWIDGFTLVAVTLVPVASEAVATEGRRFRGLRASGGMRVPVALLVTLALVVGPALVALPDFLAFRRSPETATIFRYDSARTRALSAVLRDRGTAITLTDPCLDPYTAKVVGGGAIAMLNSGMAWPDNKDKVEALLMERLEPQDLDLDRARGAGVGLLVTDPSCPINWEATNAGKLVLLRTEHYSGPDGPGVVHLWRLP